MLPNFNHITTSLCHLITVYGLIQPSAGRNKVEEDLKLCRASDYAYNHGGELTLVRYFEFFIFPMDSFCVTAVSITQDLFINWYKIGF